MHIVHERKDPLKAVKSQLSLPKTSETKQGHEGDPVFYNNVVHS
jgi:hypothetical protein